MSYSELKTLLQKYKQEHLLQFWDDLNEDEQGMLAKDINNLNLDDVTECFERATSSANDKKHLLDDMVKPVPSNSVESVKKSSRKKLLDYERLGLEEIANGRVAIVLMAGGQGTRLGVDYPKGMYNINLPSQRTLFHLQALRIRRLEELAVKAKSDKNSSGEGITLYIMTSDATHEATVAYFEKNDYFGLDRTKVKAFKQSTLPCFAFDGKIFLEEKHKISRAPDGNGGLYYALKKEGILEDMKRRGINSVHAFSVDNVLIKVADPVFLGYCLSRSASCGVKVVTKRSHDEPVGVVCQLDGLYSVVEYSEISPKTAQLKNAKGELIFSAGNICNHYFTTAFLREIADKHLMELDLHVAKKKIPYVDIKDCVRRKPTTPNGIKIEKFVFDVFKYSKDLVVWEVRREDEFSGLKNSDSAGIDCPSTARRDLLALHKKWLEDAGVEEVDGDVEVCPLLSYAGENLSNLSEIGPLRGPIYLTQVDGWTQIC